LLKILTRLRWLFIALFLLVVIVLLRERLPTGEDLLDFTIEFLKIVSILEFFTVLGILNWAGGIIIALLCFAGRSASAIMDRFDTLARRRKLTDRERLELPPARLLSYGQTFLVYFLLSLLVVAVAHR